jgi:hypothetical protein
MGKDRKMGETKKTQWILLVIVISVVMFLGIIGRVFLLKENDVIDTEPEDDWRNWPKSLSDPEDRSGYSEENTDQEIRVDIHANHVTNITFILNWTDEENTTSGPRVYENQPDSFMLSVITPWDEEINSSVIANPLGEPGIINLTIAIQEDDIANSSAVGGWNVTVHCLDCGDYDGGSIIMFGDYGNQWELIYYYEYHTNE